MTEAAFSNVGRPSRCAGGPLRPLEPHLASLNRVLGLRPCEALSYTPSADLRCNFPLPCKSAGCSRAHSPPDCVSVAGPLSHQLAGLSLNTSSLRLSLASHIFSFRSLVSQYFTRQAWENSLQFGMISGDHDRSDMITREPTRPKRCEKQATAEGC